VDGFGCEQTRKNYDVRIDQVRKAFGPRRCLLGNLDSEQLLLRNDPLQIRQAVREQFRQSGPGNPFILTTGSPLPSNVDPSAVDTMIAAAKDADICSGGQFAHPSRSKESLSDAERR
jgi:uroporphyrinogen-III decarboxylase